MALLIANLCVVTSTAGNDLLKNVVDWEAFLQRHDLVWKRMPKAWSDAPFLGNGRIALSMYAEPGTNAIRFTADRSDVYDRRDGSWGWCAYGHARYHVGDFQLHPVGKITGVDFRQDLFNAELRGTLTTDKGELTFRSFVHATLPVLVVEVQSTPGEEAFQWRWRPYEAITTRKDLPRDEKGAEKYLKNYGNPVKIWVPNPPFELREEAGIKLCVQPLLAGGGYTTAWCEVKGRDSRTLYASIAMSHPKLSSPREALTAVRDSSKTPLSKLVSSHRKWWHDYYPASFLSLSDTKVESFYWVQMYKYASAGRADSGVMDTHGPWFQPTGWPYTTFDMNTQISYWALQPANRLEIADSLSRNLDDYFTNLIQNVRPVEYQTNSAWIGVAAQQDLICPVDDDHRYSKMWCCLPWTCHNYWMQYRYSMDDHRLRHKLFPLLRRSINFYLHHLETGADGKFHLPPTFSPEYYAPDGRNLTRNCTTDLALLKWGCESLLYSCERLQIRDPLIPRWRDVVEKLSEFPTNETGLMVGRDLPLEHAHRHLGHLLPIYPLHLLNWDQVESRGLIERSLHHGAAPGLKGDFLNFTKAWAACMHACIGQSQTAYVLFMDCLESLWPNTMFAFSGQNLETPLVAVQPVHEMLLQSWGDKIRVFPAVPDVWPDVTYHDLRTEGAFLVSAVRKQGRTRSIRVKSLAGEPCKVWTDLQGPVQIQGAIRAVVEPRDNIIELKLKKGEQVLLHSQQEKPELTLAPVPAQPGRSNLYGRP
jgi:alpha-L-fucosidase 2